MNCQPGNAPPGREDAQLIGSSVSGRRTANPIGPIAMALRNEANNFVRSLWVATGSRRLGRVCCEPLIFFDRFRGQFCARARSKHRHVLTQSRNRPQIRLGYAPRSLIAGEFAPAGDLFSFLSLASPARRWTSGSTPRGMPKPNRRFLPRLKKCSPWSTSHRLAYRAPAFGPGQRRTNRRHFPSRLDRWSSTPTRRQARPARKAG